MPRSAIDQGLIMAGSFGTGYLAGSAAARLMGVIPVLGGAAALRIAGVVATGARSAQILRDRSGESGAPTDETSIWAETGAEVLVAVGVAGAASGGDRPAVGALGGVAVAASAASDVQTALALRDDHVDAKYVATATGVALGAVSVVAGILTSIRLSGRVARAATGTTGSPGALVHTAVSLGVAGALGFGAKVALARVMGSIAAGNRAAEIAYSDPPEVPEVSGGAHSLIPYDSLGLQGRRLVSVVTPTSTIEGIMGESARRHPVRVFVGVDSASSVEDRVELAIQEMHRAGGFERSTIIAASPAGTGYVNYITIEAAELMARGDIATVAIQYGDLPSMLSINKVKDASSLFGRLVERLRTEIDALDTGISLFAYGESLGAQTSQNGIESIADASGSPLDGALWVGTPHGTSLFTRMTHEEGVPVFDRPAQLMEHVADGDSVPPALLLNHDNDPVAKFTPSMLYSIPDWLAASKRGRGMNPHQRWLPGVAFWQGLIDTKNAATVVPGEFKSTGHDYRADLASFIRVAYGFSDVTDDQMMNIEQKLRDSEIERAKNIALGTVQSA
jgi:uncharacterized membrane protein